MLVFCSFYELLYDSGNVQNVQSLTRAKRVCGLTGVFQSKSAHPAIILKALPLKFSCRLESNQSERFSSCLCTQFERLQYHFGSNNNTGSALLILTCTYQPNTTCKGIQLLGTMQKLRIQSSACFENAENYRTCSKICYHFYREKILISSFKNWQKRMR